MTVHGINSGNSGPSDPDSPSTEDSQDNPVKGEEVVQENHNHQRTSCFFEWRLLPQHKIEEDDNVVEGNSTLCKFKCDLCLGMYILRSRPIMS